MSETVMLWVALALQTATVLTWLIVMDRAASAYQAETDAKVERLQGLIQASWRPEAKGEHGEGIE